MAQLTDMRSSGSLIWFDERWVSPITLRMLNAERRMLTSHCRAWLPQDRSRISNKIDRRDVRVLPRRVVIVSKLC